MIVKEFIQMRRDRLTFAMMVGVPMMQLMLFGYAINTDPKHCRPRCCRRRRAATRAVFGGDAEHRLFRFHVQVRDPEEPTG